MCSTSATEIHLIFDRYLSPSIEDSERESRKEFDIPYNILNENRPESSTRSGMKKTKDVRAQAYSNTIC